MQEVKRENTEKEDHRDTENTEVHRAPRLAETLARGFQEDYFWDGKNRSFKKHL